MKSIRVVAPTNLLVLVFLLAGTWIGCHRSDRTSTAMPDTTKTAVTDSLTAASQPIVVVPPAQAPPSPQTRAKTTNPMKSRVTGASSESPGDRLASTGGERSGPTERTVMVAEGTVIKGALQAPLSSKTNRVGDSFSLLVSEPVIIDDLTVIPRGVVINGTVKAVEPAGRAGQKASMTLVFDSITLASGQRLALGINQYFEGQGDAEVEGESKKKRNTALIAGGAAAGALAGRILGKDTKSTMIGAAAGGAAGTAAALALKGGEVDLKAGTPLTITLDHHLHVPVRVISGSEMAEQP